MAFVEYDEVERTLEPVTVTETVKAFVKYDEAECILEPVIVTGSVKTSVHFIFPNKQLQCF